MFDKPCVWRNDLPEISQPWRSPDESVVIKIPTLLSYAKQGQSSKLGHFLSVKRDAFNNYSQTTEIDWAIPRQLKLIVLLAIAGINLCYIVETFLR